MTELVEAGNIGNNADRSYLAEESARPGMSGSP